MKDLPVKALKTLLRERAERLVAMLEEKSMPSFIINREAAGIFHAVMRIHGEKGVKKELRRLIKRHNRRMNGLCEKCGKPAKPDSNLCEKCINKRKAESSDEIREMLEGAALLGAPLSSSKIQ